MTPSTDFARMLRAFTVMAVACGTAVDADDHLVDLDRWRTAIHYRNTFAAEGARAGTLYVAAVDSFQVWFNGEPVGAAADARRSAEIPVELVNGGNHIAVRVVNHGLGEGHGMVAVVAADTLAGVHTTTDRSIQSWYWSEALQDGADWLTEEAADLEWSVVQKGSFDPAGVEGLPAGARSAVAGFPGGIDAGHAEGGLRLKQIDGQNLAVGTPANRIEVVDGDLNTSWDPPVNALNFTASLDLQVRRNIHTLRALTRPGRSEQELEDNSLRGYSVHISDDQIRWSEVGVLRGITEYASTEVSFRPTWTRYIRLVIMEINAVTQPRVAEVEVYGSGHTDRGAFVSEPLDLGRPDAAKNLGRLWWQADVPERTRLWVQFRSGQTQEDFGDPEAGWSRTFDGPGDTLWFPAAEPARLLQYRVGMSTRDDTRTPVFRQLLIESSQDLAATGARGHVSPQTARIGVDTTFHYTLDLSFGDEALGVEGLAIEVPSQAELLNVSGLGSRSVSSWSSTQRSLRLEFDEPLLEDTQLGISFTTRTFATAHSFRSALFSPGSENPLNVQENTDVDEVTGEALSWHLLAILAPQEVLSRVRAHPPAFSPNGDGINDFTVIEMVLSKVDVPAPVRVEVHDLSGRLVASLGEAGLTAGTYFSDAFTGPGSPGYWDGRDGAGALVPPGLYLYRVEVQLDTGDEVSVGTVAVAY